MEIAQDKIDEFEFVEAAEGFRELVREFSPCGRKVMVVGVKPNSTYTFSLFTWDCSEVEYIGSGYWALCSEGGVYSDFDAAYKEAVFDLKACIAESEI
jgi:hypothetical protein